jgi:ATP-dependent Clp protease adapter protein ClpS
MKKQEKKGADKSANKSADESTAKSELAVDSFKVLLHNDDQTSMEFVVFILQSIFDKSEEEATTITMQVHNEGQGVAGSYSLDVARSKVTVVKVLAKARCFPLKCTIENQEDSAMTQKSVQHQPPAGWIMAGSDPDDYEVGIDKAVAHSGTRCAYVTHAVESPRGFGTLMQQMLPDEYLGKRLRLKMWVKTEDVIGRVQPWIRVDGAKRGKMLGFDNTCNRHTSGTTDWSECEMVLDVPEAATNIAFGIMLAGRGRLWMDDVNFDVVGKDVPTTDCPCGSRAKAKNLSFEE